MSAQPLETCSLENWDLQLRYVWLDLKISSETWDRSRTCRSESSDLHLHNLNCEQLWNLAHPSVWLNSPIIHPPRKVDPVIVPTSLGGMSQPNMMLKITWTTPFNGIYTPSLKSTHTTATIASTECKINIAALCKIRFSSVNFFTHVV